MADIKYLLKFGKREHLESLVSGNIYCSNAITFWGIEDKLKIKGQGDILEAGTRMFAQKMIMQHPDTKEVIAKCGKANGLVRIEPAEKMPVFCMFAVYEDDCKVDITGASIINLSDDKKQTIREHFPNADAVAVIPNPEEFIEDVKRSIGTEIKAEKVNYFHIDKGYETTDGEIAMDMEYMKYLMQWLDLVICRREAFYLAKKKDEITIRSSAAEYLTYVASVGDQQDSIEMRYEDENIWLTQKMMATLYDVGSPTINEHIKKIYADSELEEAATIRNFRIVQTEGSRQVTRDTKHYSLQMIIAVGFKVNSERAVQFRKWVNQIAKDYTIKGWVMDDERLKRGTYLTEKYFDEQLERIREIRASERKFYQKITDLYATAIDYDKNAATTRRFYATVQNKMHYAVHGHTAAEMIVERADHTKEHMGLTTWADAPDGKIKKSDVTVAKNYLSQDEMKQLNRMVTAYLDFAENMTLRHIPLTMQDWEKRLNSFIEMFDYGILQDAGKVSAEIAKLHAETEFEKYRVIQDSLFMSDFDRYMLELEESAKK